MAMFEMDFLSGSISPYSNKRIDWDEEVDESKHETERLRILRERDTQKAQDAWKELRHVMGIKEDSALTNVRMVPAHGTDISGMMETNVLHVLLTSRRIRRTSYLDTSYYKLCNVANQTGGST